MVCMAPKIKKAQNKLNKGFLYEWFFQHCKPSSSHERLQAALLCFISPLQSLSSFSVEQRTKRKKTPKFFSLHSFAEAGYPFVDNIRFFLQECVELEDYEVERISIWVIFLVHEAGVGANCNYRFGSHNLFQEQSTEIEQLLLNPLIGDCTLIEQPRDMSDEQYPVELFMVLDRCDLLRSVSAAIGWKSGGGEAASS
nr:PHD finger protein MALE MEIOCYTE DEATH 1 [Ipomoea batatas]